MFLKISAQVFEAEDFLNIFLSFVNFWGLFCYKNPNYKKKVPSILLPLGLPIILEILLKTWKTNLNKINPQ